MSQTIDAAVLRDACALLSSPVRWTCGAWARDSSGARCSPLSPRARQWCAWGALHKSAFALIGDKDASRKVADRISKQLVPCPGGLAFVNERGGYDLVRAVMGLGGPPAKAERTWPFPDFRTPAGFAAFLRREWLCTEGKLNDAPCLISNLVTMRSTARVTVT
jgi:hypothetical protein